MNKTLKIFFMWFSIMALLMGCEGKKEQPLPTVEKKLSGIIDVEDAKLHYAIQGNGIPCVVLGVSIGYSRVFSQGLRQSLKFIFLGLRHDAQSESSMEINKITLETYVNDIDQARKTLGLEKIAVLGHSGHGMMALEYARQYPQNTSHVIMIGTPPLMDEEYNKALDELWEKQASDERKIILKQNWEKLTEDALSQMTSSRRSINTYLANAPKVWNNPTYDATWIFEGYEYNMDVFSRVWGEVLTAYNVARLPGQIKTPIFLALGKHDYLVPYYLWDDRKDNLTNLSYNLFEKSGHFPMFEEQKLFDKKLNEWIKNH